MSFQPVVPMGGFAGWAFLQRTMEAQREAYDTGPEISRETAYFAENIGKVSTAEDLVADRTLLKVALGAFGLAGDIDNRAFVRKVLEEGVIDGNALANKLSDKRYYELAKAFKFDLSTPATAISNFPDEINAAYRDRRFETAIGEQNQDMRLAMGLERDLTAIAEKTISEDAKWFQIMGTAPLRQVFETAFNLPASFGTIDLDQQLEVLKARAGQAFGDESVSQFATSEGREELVRRFFALSEINAGPGVASGASAALSLLQANTLSPLVEI